MAKNNIDIDGEGHSSADAPREFDFQNNHYLRFGGEADFVESRLNIESARNYLLSQGFQTGNLTHSRSQRGISHKYRGYRAPGSHACDFCGKAITGADYDVLRDGRERCRECGRTVVTGKETLVRLFNEVKDDYCVKYGIKYAVTITVRITTAEQIAKRRGKTFVPTPGFDSRAVGLAIKEGDSYAIMLENETPRLSIVSVIVHELTHIWQFTNWDLNKINSDYGSYVSAIMEGMAVWADVQYLYLIGEGRHAETEMSGFSQRGDEYGYGFRLYLEQYPLSTGVVLEGGTPFDNPGAPIDHALMKA